MRKINLEDYSFEIEDENRNKKVDIYNVKDSLVKILFRDDDNLNTKELLHRDELTKKLKECKENEIILEDEHYNELKKIIEKGKFKREDTELVRRILEAEKDFEKKVEHPKTRKRGKLTKRLLVYSLLTAFLYQGWKTWEYYANNSNTNDSFTDCIMGGMQYTINDVKNVYNSHIKKQHNESSQREYYNSANEKLQEENKEIIENTPVEDYESKGEVNTNSIEEEQKARDREIEERIRQIDAMGGVKKIKGLLEGKALIERSYGDKFKEKINNQFSWDVKQRYETMVSQLEELKQENPTLYELGKKAYENDPLRDIDRGIENSESINKTDKNEQGRLENLLGDVPLEKETKNNEIGKLDKSYIIKEKKNLGDNITKNYKTVIVDSSNNKSSLNFAEGTNGGRSYCFTYGLSTNYFGGRRYIEVKKGEAKTKIPFSKIESIEFLENLGQDGIKSKISFWDGNSEEFNYLKDKGEYWEGETSYGHVEMPTEKIKTIIFLRE